MNTIIKPILLSVLSVLILSACQKNIDDQPVEKETAHTGSELFEE